MKFIDYEDDIVLFAVNGDGFMIIDTSLAHNIISLARDNAARFWPIIKHYAETGELVEAPNVIDNSIPARDDATTHEYTIIARDAKQLRAIGVIGKRVLAANDDYMVIGAQDEIVFIAPRESLVYILRNDSISGEEKEDD